MPSSSARPWRLSTRTSRPAFRSRGTTWPPRVPAVWSCAAVQPLRNVASALETTVAGDHVAVRLALGAHARRSGRLLAPSRPLPAVDQLLDRRERRLRDLRRSGACSVGSGGLPGGTCH